MSMKVRMRRDLALTSERGLATVLILPKFLAELRFYCLKNDALQPANLAAKRLVKLSFSETRCLELDAQ